jgi:hypothetical protein
MTYLALVCGLILPWVLGVSLLLAVGWPRASADVGEAGANGSAVALRLGYGYFAGAILLTLWMRALSVVGVPFGRASIGVPLLIAVVALLAWARRRHRVSLTALRAALASLVRPPPARWQRWVWIALAAWLALRFASLAMEVAWRPLYPWDAWLQWATKARVWYELGRIVPFERGYEWLASGNGAYFDAAPNYPATIPLLQVWSCIALGRWDDSAMNWPWLLMLVALTLAVFGALRDAGVPALGALVGAYLVASLPLLDAHVALAGYADLMMGAVYTLATLAFYRWTLRRDPRDAALALLFALACPLIKIPGFVWALTLVPGVIVALLPRHGLRLAGIALGCATLILLALAQFEPTILGYRLHLDYRPPWQSLGEAYFLFDNWHLLAYAVVALALVGARRLVAPPLAPLAVVVACALAFLFVVFAFTNAAAWMADYTTVNRATLHVAPLLACLCVLLWRELTTVAVSPPAAVAPSARVAADA